MRTPSVKTLSTIFDDNAKQAKRFLTCDRKTLLAESQAASNCQMQSYERQPTYYLRLIALNDLGDFHGVEYCETQEGDVVEYLNAGDTYNATLIFWRGRWRVTTLGDFIETMERSGVKFL